MTENTQDSLEISTRRQAVYEPVISTNSAWEAEGAIRPKKSCLFPVTLP